jgi:uncharacterized protein YgbK (DUF1537 family)
MHEADLRMHLAKQTRLESSLFDIQALEGNADEVAKRLERLIMEEEPDILLFDVLDDQRLKTAGRVIWNEASGGEGVFIVGSSGVEYALASCWQADGLLPQKPDGSGTAEPVEQLLVVSGSCSPVTEEQIRMAMASGFAGIRVPVQELVQAELADSAYARMRDEALSLLDGGRSVILYSAAGPADESIAVIREVLAKQGLRAEDSSRLLGKAMGLLTKELVAAAGLSRVLIAGGDTSGYVMRELGIFGLECTAMLDPGGPLCRSFSKEAAMKCTYKFDVPQEKKIRLIMNTDANNEADGLYGEELCGNS